MDHFNYHAGQLLVEDVPVKDIASQISTPAYIYSKATFLDHLQKIQKAYKALDTTICFSIKACSNINILKIMSQAGSGFDIVSGGELFRALSIGADPSKIVYASVGKTDKEISEAIDAGIGYFNIESESELANIIEIARTKNKTVKAALRINPDVDYKTHAYITTGKKETKFGVDIDRAYKVFETYGSNGNVDLCAIHIHLGSGGKTTEPYANAIKKILPVIDKLRAGGHRIEMLDIGGGFGADYESDTVPSAEDYAGDIVPLLLDKDLKLVLEPGKSICANGGILLTRVLYTKQGGSKKFVIVDAGMNDLIRPSLYEAFHFIWPCEVNEQFIPEKRLAAMSLSQTEQIDIVGPICEGADFLAKGRHLPPVKRGDLLAVFAAGAYGFTMSSNYNSRCLCPEVLVDNNKFTVISRRQNYDDLISLER